MLNKGLIYNQQKDKRISWLSVFSSLCANKRVEGDDVFELANQAFDIVDKLYKKYPLPTPDGEDIKPLNEPRPINNPNKDISLDANRPF